MPDGLENTDVQGTDSEQNQGQTSQTQTGAYMQGKPAETAETKPGTDEQVSPLTEQDALKLIQESAKEVAKQVTREIRRFQSMTDKVEARLKAETNRMEGILQKAGIELTPEQKRTIEGEARETLRTQIEQGETSQNGEQQPDGGAVSQAVIQKVNEKLQLQEIEYGVILDRDDPEYGLVNWQDPNPTRFLKQHEAMLKTKANRLQSANPQVGDKSNIIVTQNKGGTKPNLADKSPDELLEMAYPRK